MKLRIYLQVISIITITGFSLSGYSQQKQDSLKQKRARQQHVFYRQTLQIDSAKAQKVAQIQESYKAGMNQLMTDTSLSDEGRRARIKALMDIKNQQLRLLLSPAQQAKIIPTTEREKPASAKSN